MATYLYDKLKEIKNIYPFHMPGHKRNRKFMDINALELDCTEIKGLDNLHDPKGVILKAQEEMAKYTRADKSFFLVNGGSSGMLSAVYACVNEGDTVIVASNCHASVYNALVLSRADAVYVVPEISEEGIICGIDPKSIEEALLKYKAKAVVITSVTYEGLVSDVKAIADITHNHGAILIADECHGAHFGFSKYFPKFAIECGADISVNSWHKSLPAFNQAAVLNIKGKRVDENRLKKTISFFNTTSPSYPIMASMDKSRQYLLDNGEYFNIYIRNLNILREELRENKYISLLDIKNKYSVHDRDIGKITLVIKGDTTGYNVADVLREKGIEAEFASVNEIILMTSVADDFSYYKILSDIIKNIDKGLKEKENNFKYLKYKSFYKPFLTPYKAFYSEKEYVCKNNAIGRICGENITAYPPDIPIVSLGEKIEDYHIENIETLKNYGADIMGIYDDKLCVVK